MLLTLSAQGRTCGLVKHSLLRTQLVRHEALRLKPYKDTVGKLTIGVGRNLDDVGITEDEAMELLENDIKSVEQTLTSKVACFGSLDDPRQRVLADMAFNMGTAKLLTFVKFLAAVEARDWERAADEMLDSTWAKQVGKRATELATQLREGVG